ncbi:MAG: LamG domain-containing protein [Phycisphaerales bacterium]|nr:LamG domain-containing protein [Phycisphaerales bacterium]
MFKNMISVLAVASVMATFAFTAVSTEAAMVGHWQFDNSGNVGQATVSSNLQTVGNASYSASGKVGGALSLDGNGDYLRVDGSDTLATGMPTGDGSYTIAAFIQTTTAGKGIIGWGSYGSGASVNALRTDGAKLLNYSWGGGVDYSASAPTILDGQWHHVAATYDAASSTKRLYFDGAEIGSGKVIGDLTVGAQKFRIGSTNNGEYFNGLLDDMRVYNTALSESEISGLSVPEPATMSLLALGGLAILRRRRRS